MPTFTGGRRRYRPLRQPAETPTAAYKTQWNESRDSLPHETAKRAKPKRAESRQVQHGSKLQPWLYLVAERQWFTSLGAALEAFLPAQISRLARPELRWVKADGAVWIGEWVLELPGRAGERKTLIGCVAEKAQQLEHDLLD